MKKKSSNKLSKRISKQPTTTSWASGKKKVTKIKRTYKDISTYKPYDGTHGFKLQREFYEDGYKRYTLNCLCCPDNVLEIHATPDELYPMIEIGGVLFGWETLERIFAEVFHKKTLAKKQSK